MNRQGSAATTATRRVVILGASARALAQSAAAAGWEVHAADLFGDADLLAVAERAERLDPSDYPAGLAAAAASMPAAPWCYTGALENHAALIDAITAARPLAGNRGDAVRAVRDPRTLEHAAHAAGLRYPETHATPDIVPIDGSFLVKPLASAGGRGIRPWRGDHGTTPDAGRVWQRRIGGIPHAAAFLIDRHGPRLIGLSRQLVAAPWCHAGPFSYCGSVVVPPAAVRPAVADQMVRLGAMLAERFRLVGAVGVDMILDPDGVAWVVEVNPRFTASMELHERASGESIAASHLAACGFGRPRNPPGGGRGSGCVWAKGVLHAAQAIEVTPAVVGRWHALAAAWSPGDGEPPLLADVPLPGQVVGRAAPLLTVFAGGPTVEAAVAGVAARAAAILDVSRPSASASPPHARCTA
jgi:predicted ATP-grasp superfamily ATP-dependent carboligase